jgi:DNA mismatch repair protein MutL
MRIQVLSEALSNQIAAGEVVERPASVVKELLENSVDAGAGAVDVDVEKAGSKLIRVRDDGAGVAADDLPLAFLRHATSKISTTEDLFRVQTLGFRGEALPSIASVAKVRMVSRPAGTDEGAEITVEGGTIGGAKKCGAPEGTMVEVRDLFYNVPVRRKFLKSDSTEMGHISEAVTRAALAHWGVHFTLTRDGRSVFNVPAAGAREERVAAFFGEKVREALLPVEARHPVLELKGLAAKPTLTRPNSRMQYYLLNGRYIRDATISHAVMEAYRSLLGQRQYPVVFLWMRADPEQVDVNVHPTKIEVRWRRPQMIHELVYRAVREGLRQGQAIPSPVSRGPAPGAGAGEVKGSIRQAITDFFSQGSAPRGAPAGPRSGDLWAASRAAKPAPETEAPAGEGDAANVSAAPAAAAERPRMQPGEDSSVVAPLAEPDRGPAGVPVAGGRRFLQVLDAYIVEETDEGVRITDQHALHERILYERILAQLQRAEVVSQRLLIPELLELSAEEFFEVMALRETFGKLGLEFDEFGQRTIIVRAVPQMFKNVKTSEFFRELLAEYAEARGRGGGVPNRLELLARVMACKAAVKAGQRLSVVQVRELLAMRERCPGAMTCPHGRPTSWMIEAVELEKRFKRR